ncbi:MAG: UDP-N-acetylmuramoyl-L-alanyl-D-glutamate--2,6-diaminopimelate ligase [Clostridia bacterium]|nr:UDP-N-acetylmuramoyl-L-alanyl-D-glutamate--2,6-diaminopimelate ligase [Clostridia bacterium]
MKLFDLITEKEVLNPAENWGTIEINGVCCDTRTIKTGDAFFALAGAKEDGAVYAKEAAEKGAACVVAEKPFAEALSVPTVLVHDVRESFANACFAAVGNPQKKIKIIGVTGTNGKTTITNVIKKILTDAGKKCAMFTTVGYDVCGAFYPSSHTTPPPEKLAPLFAEACRGGAEYAVMEVSSHAIAQKRVGALRFEVGIFTNITRDHLDYHKTMEEYTRVKASFFALCKNSVINLDDEKAHEIAAGAKENVCFVSAKKEADYTIKDIHISPDGMRYTLCGAGKEMPVSLAVAGDFNICNTAEAAVACLLLGISEKDICASLVGFGGVAGRMETVAKNVLPYTVIIDYAHTPDALIKALEACRKITRGTLYCVFGCGGNRDRGKRFEMGEIATRLADVAIITSDNPRNEEPEDIIADIVSGVDGGRTNYVTIVSRKEAIEYALENAKAGDVILLAGKGHETYIIDKDGTHYFSEKDVVMNFTERKEF